MNKYKIGILAYGSLIDEPGSEIKPLIIERIECMTLFKVEYARKSVTRGDCPTLIPTEDVGKRVKASILVLEDKTDTETAKSLLYRRETRRIGTGKEYVHSNNPSINKTQVETLNNIENVETVLYTKLGSNINEIITPELLSDLAIASILTKAGDKFRDGIRYLLANKNNSIETQFSEEYEKLILEKTGTDSLEQAIDKMDIKRLN